MNDLVRRRQVEVGEPSSAVQRHLECAPQAEACAAAQRRLERAALHALRDNHERLHLRHRPDELHRVRVVDAQQHGELRRKLLHGDGLAGLEDLDGDRCAMPPRAIHHAVLALPQHLPEIEVRGRDLVVGVHDVEKAVRDRASEATECGALRRRLQYAALVHRRVHLHALASTLGGRARRVARSRPRGAGRSILVEVWGEGARLQEELRDGRALREQRVHEGRAAEAVDGVDARALRKQPLCRCECALGRCEVQRRAAVVVAHRRDVHLVLHAQRIPCC